jgi:hypothetical protein
MPGPFPSPSARLSALDPFPLSPEERAALGPQLEQLSRVLEALAGFVSREAEPASGFDPLGGEG